MIVVTMIVNIVMRKTKLMKEMKQVKIKMTKKMIMKINMTKKMIHHYTIK